MMGVRDLTDGEILEHLKKNTIFRNEQLSVLVKLLNSIEIGSTLAIDGAWGSGKTVFVKQLQLLADESVEDYGHNTLNDSEISKLREEQEVIYFNAWENDYVGDALGATLLKLIADSGEGLNEAVIKRALSMIDPSAAIKKLTHELVDLEAKPKKDKLIEHIKPLIDRREAVNELLDTIKLKKDKTRLIFIIDELDRCKPSFAVDLLEVIKHYFVRDDVTFIVATNTTQLSHTIKKYYGYEFDGYSYLNKFFDFTFGLQKVDIANYARDALDWVPNGYVVHEVAHDMIKHYSFEMREINAYHSALRLIDNFLSRSGNYRNEQNLVQLVLVPIALGLKIKDNKKYSEFVSGKGEIVLREFLPHSDASLTSVSRSVSIESGMDKDQAEELILNSVVDQYLKLFMPGEYRGVREDLQDFNDAVSLISSYTTIQDIGDKK
jgi:hypothetical protein